MGKSLDGGFPFLRALRYEQSPPPPEMKMYSLAVTPNGHLEGRGSLPPPVIMRTAATPMPTPKSSPNLDTAHSLLDLQHSSSSSVDPQLGDQKSLVGTVPCPGFRAPSGSSLKTSEGPTYPLSLPHESVAQSALIFANRAEIAVLMGGAQKRDVETHL